jgi:hypothetical protein
MTTQAAMIKGYTREIELTDGVYNCTYWLKKTLTLREHSSLGVWMTMNGYQSMVGHFGLTMKRSTLCQSMMTRRRLGLSVLLP